MNFVIIGPYNIVLLYDVYTYFNEFSIVIGKTRDVGVWNK